MCRVYAQGAAFLVLFAAQAAHAADPYKAAAGPYAVAMLEADWQDAARPGGAVTVPVKVYFPKAISEGGFPTATMPSAPLPLIVFSHGLGGSREGYSLWAQHWASHGYIVVLPTHEGSDTEALLAAAEAMGDTTKGGRSLMNVQTTLRRVQDVSFVITRMLAANAGTTDDKALAPFKGKVDDKHIGMAGHSFGALTTLMIAGEGADLVGPLAGADKRVTAAIAMSPQPAKADDQKKAFGSIRIPVFHMTGTEDVAPLNLSDVTAAERRIPFDNSTFPGTSLVIFDGATHMTFSARGTNPLPREQNIFSLIKQSTTAFWDAHLKGDAKAAAWLEKDFAEVMGAAGKLEQRKP